MISCSFTSNLVQQHFRLKLVARVSKYQNKKYIFHPPPLFKKKFLEVLNHLFSLSAGTFRRCGRRSEGRIINPNSRVQESIKYELGYRRLINYKEVNDEVDFFVFNSSSLLLFLLHPFSIFSSFSIPSLFSSSFFAHFEQFLIFFQTMMNGNYIFFNEHLNTRQFPHPH